MVEEKIVHRVTRDDGCTLLLKKINSLTVWCWTGYVGVRWCIVGLLEIVFGDWLSLNRSLKKVEDKTG